jgi:hypothetical protein
MLNIFKLYQITRVGPRPNYEPSSNEREKNCTIVFNRVKIMGIQHRVFLGRFNSKFYQFPIKKLRDEKFFMLIFLVEKNRPTAESDEKNWTCNSNWALVFCLENTWIYNTLNLIV